MPNPLKLLQDPPEFARPSAAHPPALVRTRIQVVEDERVIAEALQFVLEQEDGFEVVAVSGTVAEAVAAAKAHRPDVVLMDYNLPDGTGVEAARAMYQELPAVAIVMLSGDSRESAVLGAIEMGAAGYLDKSVSLKHVVSVLRLAADGEVAVPRELLARAIKRQRQAAQADAGRQKTLDQLTRREIEVFRLIAEGLNNRTISERLGVSLTTTRGHVQKILEKLEVHSKLAAMAKAAELGITA